MDKKVFKKLTKTYKQVLNRLNKKASTNTTFLADYFVTQLKLLRDTCVLNGIDDVNLSGITLLSTAIEEYEAYKDCFNKYFKVSRTGLPERKDTGKTADETAKAYSAERKIHWDTFWELVRLNLEFWTTDPAMIK